MAILLNIVMSKIMQCCVYVTTTATWEPHLANAVIKNTFSRDALSEYRKQTGVHSGGNSRCIIPILS